MQILNWLQQACFVHHTVFPCFVFYIPAAPRYFVMNPAEQKLALLHSWPTVGTKEGSASWPRTLKYMTGGCGNRTTYSMIRRRLLYMSLPPPLQYLSV